jgi:hypothetical protein
MFASQFDGRRAARDNMVSAPVQSIDGPFVPASADQPLDVGLHQQLQDALGHSTQKVTVASLLQKLIQWQSLLGHRGFSGQCEVEQLHPRCLVPAFAGAG